MSPPTMKILQFNNWKFMCNKQCMKINVENKRIAIALIIDLGAKVNNRQ